MGTDPALMSAVVDPPTAVLPQPVTSAKTPSSHRPASSGPASLMGVWVSSGADSTR